MKILLFLIPILFLFTACEIDTDESNRYEVLQLIDSGDFISALDELGDCSDSKGFTEEECHINRGVSYFGLAGYDITSIGEELYEAYSDDTIADDEKSIKVISILFDRFKGDSISDGLTEYKLALDSSDLNESACNLANFSNLSVNAQQSCISINPILLLDIIDDKDEAQDSLITVDLQDLIDIEKSVRGIAPNITSTHMAYLLNNEIEKTSENIQNEIDATQCLIIEERCSDLGFRNPIFISNYNEFKIWKLSKLREDFSTIKLTDNIGSVLLLEENLYITKDESNCSETEYLKYDGQCFPKPIENEETLTSSIVDKLNDDNDFRDSVALMINVGDDNLDENEQIDQFMIDICGFSDCIVDETNLIQYFYGEGE